MWDGLEGNVHILGYLIKILKLFSCMILKVWRLLGTAINSPNIGMGKNSQSLHGIGRLMPSTPTPYQRCPSPILQTLSILYLACQKRF